jgi:tRNA A-37 threonylcarbamoyl transferase component Bud32
MHRTRTQTLQNQEEYLDLEIPEKRLNRTHHNMKPFPKPRSLQIQKARNTPYRRMRPIDYATFRAPNYYLQDKKYIPDINEEFLEEETDHKLGEGSFGCVIRGPFIISSTQNNNNMYDKDRMGEVFKLMVNKHDFRLEIKNTLIANKIDNNKIDKSSPSITITGFSILNRDDLKTLFESDDDDMKKLRQKIKGCKTIEKYLRDNVHEVYQIMYSDEGISLQYLHEYHGRTEFSIQKVLGLCLNLMKGVSRYVRHSFVHLDIKADNIIYIPPKNGNFDKLVFIDFGISGFIKNINLNIFHILKNIYLLPEIVANNIIKKYKNHSKSNQELFYIFKRTYEYNLNHIYNHFKDLLVHYLYNDNIMLYKRDLMKLFEKIMNSSETQIEALIRHNLIHYDAYKLCFTIMELIEQYNFRDAKYNHIIDAFYKNVLMPVAFIDPEKRAPIQSVLPKYRDFLKTLPRYLRHSI